MKAWRQQACSILLDMAQDEKADRCDRILAARMVLEFTKDAESGLNKDPVGFEGSEAPDVGCGTGGYAPDEQG